jgi:hypothetical protein
VVVEDITEVIAVVLEEITEVLAVVYAVKEVVAVVV